MSMQEILIGLLFVVAVGFVGRKIYQEFTAKSGCAKGCGACDMTKNSPTDN